MVLFFYGKGNHEFGLEFSVRQIVRTDDLERTATAKRQGTGKYRSQSPWRRHHRIPFTWCYPSARPYFQSVMLIYSHGGLNSHFLDNNN